MSKKQDGDGNRNSMHDSDRINNEGDQTKLTKPSHFHGPNQSQHSHQGKNTQNTSLHIQKYKFIPLPNPTKHSPLKLKEFLIPNAHFCSENNLEILIYTHSAVDHFDLRLAIRNTWGSKALLDKEKAALMFVLGRSFQNEKVQKKIMEEYLEYKDIVQADFIDDYYNLTYKAFMSIQWLKRYCKNVPIIIKTDDDIFWDVESVLNIIRKNINARSVICKIFRRSRIFRHPPCGKWCVKEDEFVNKTYYPRYCQGVIYAFDGNLVEELSIAMGNTSFFDIDDVWVGLVLGKLVEVSWIDICRYVAGSRRFALGNYDKHKDITKTITYVTGNKSHNVGMLWHLLTILKQNANVNLEVQSYMNTVPKKNIC